MFTNGGKRGGEKNEITLGGSQKEKKGRKPWKKGKIFRLLHMRKKRERKKKAVQLVFVPTGEGTQKEGGAKRKKKLCLHSTGKREEGERRKKTPSAFR